jgi:hypothetical protein
VANCLYILSGLIINTIPSDAFCRSALASIVAAKLFS